MVRHPSAWQKIGRTVELVLLFIIVPAVTYLYQDLFGMLLIPLLLGAGGWCLFILLTDETFDTDILWNTDYFWTYVQDTLTTFIPGAGITLLAIQLFAPDMLFGLLHENIWLWLLALLPYPLLSVYPQELIFRTFFFHRYDDIFSTTRAKIIVSGALFGFAHILFNNLFAVVTTLGAGIVFAHTYARTRSTLQASIEHALWGGLIFTVGLHTFFYVGEPEALFRMLLNIG